MPVTNYIWDEVNDTLLMEKDEAGDTTAAYTYEPGQYGPLISQRRGGQTSYYQLDGMGSTRQLTDANGDITDSYTYTAFGEPVTSSGATTNPFGFKGSLGYYANPETGDTYVRSRVYNPIVGRWMSVDPLDYMVVTTRARRYARDSRVSGADLLRLRVFADRPLSPLSGSFLGKGDLLLLQNPFLYVENSPTVHDDPSGLASECRLGIFDENDPGTVGADGRHLKCAAEAAYGKSNAVPMGSGTIDAAVNVAVSRGCCIRELGVFDHGSAFNQMFNEKAGLTPAEVASLCAHLCHGAVVQLWGCHQMVAPATTNATIAALFACGKISTVWGCKGRGRMVNVKADGTCCWGQPYCDGGYAFAVNPIYTPPPVPWPIGIPPVCFVEGTLVAVPDGFTPIERLRVGDSVLAFDFGGRSVARDRVLRTHRTEVSSFLNVAMEGESLLVTSQHPFYLLGRGWTRAQNLSAGNHLWNRGGSDVEITAVHQVSQKAIVFNISVGEHQNYLVGGRAILVHNK